MYRLAAPIVGILLVLPVAKSVRADFADDLRLCTGSISDVEAQIAACTRVLESKRLQGRDLAVRYNNRGFLRLYRTRRDLDGAIVDYTQAIQIYPKEASFYLNRGITFENKGEFDKAILDFDQALRVAPNWRQAFDERADARRDNGNIDQAIADYDDEIKRHPDEEWNFDAEKAVALFKAGRADEGLPLIERSLQRLPKYPNFLDARAHIREALGDFPGALSDYQAARQNFPPRANSPQWDRLAKDINDGFDRVASKVGSAASPKTELTTSAPPNASPSPNVGPPAPSVPSPELSERRVALVIGNSAYANIPRLTNPRNDAKLVADTLTLLGFQLVDGGPQLDLDKAGMDRVVQEFGTKLQGAEVGLFYYAGHGVQVHGSNYLVPIDANPIREADVDFQMLDANLVLRQMADAGTKMNLVILDACRNNPLAGRGLRSASGGLAQMQAPEGTLISFATQPGNVALDGDSDSPYSKALAKEMRRPGLDVFRTFNEVGLEVSSVTGGTQQPWLSLSPLKGDFYFAGK